MIIIMMIVMMMVGCAGDAREAAGAGARPYPPHGGDQAAGAQPQLQREDVQGEDCRPRGSGQTQKDLYRRVP